MKCTLTTGGYIIYIRQCSSRTCCSHIDMSFAKLCQQSVEILLRVDANTILEKGTCLDKCHCVAGEVQAPGSQSQEAGRAADAAQAFASAEQQSLLQFLRMMRKGKVGSSSSPSRATAVSCRPSESSLQLCMCKCTSSLEHCWWL